MRSRVLVRLLLALAPLIPFPAFACTPAPGYRTPTNFELVQQADLIVLARVVDGPDEPFGPRAEVSLAPVRVLKGTLPGDPLRLIGSLKWNGRTVPSMPTPLAASHFSAGMGGCIRLFYPKGGLVVALFQRTEVTEKHAFPFAMTPMFEPFARAAEDVESEQGVWVKAVEAYVALQAGGDAAHLRSAVTRKRQELLSDKDDLAAQAMAEDLAEYLEQTGPGDRPERVDQPHWRHIDLPDESVALLGSKTVKARILRCKAGGSAVEVYWPQEEGEVKHFRFGEQRFALTPATLALSPDLRSASATLALDAPLLAVLGERAALAGLDMSAGPLVAPSRDVLQKFSARCAALLGSSRAE